MLSSSNLFISQISIPWMSLIPINRSWLSILHLSRKTWRWWSFTPLQLPTHNIKSYITKVLPVSNCSWTVESSYSSPHLNYWINYSQVGASSGWLPCSFSTEFWLREYIHKGKAPGKFPWLSGQFPPDWFWKTPNSVICEVSKFQTAFTTKQSHSAPREVI